MNIATMYYKLLIVLGISAISLLNMGFVPHSDNSHTHKHEAHISNDAGVSQLTGRKFASVKEAVVAAANRYNPISVEQDREFLGAIVLLDGDYRYTVGYGESGQDTVNLRLRLPKNAKVVAFWHTHGDAAPNRRYFSEIDTKLAMQWQLPFYLADYTGALRVFEPGKSRIRYAGRRSSISRDGSYSKGARVSNEDGSLIRVNS
jgi:hypothetical protein